MTTLAAPRPAATPDSAAGFVRACSLSELQAKGCLTPTGLGQSVVLFWHQDTPYALDNRCPHMGFPLSKGFCKDGILTCYWHYARFDLKSGGTFDPFADDVRAFPVAIRGSDVYIDLRPQQTADEERRRWTTRLRDAIDQNISLVQAKAILVLLDNASAADPAKGVLDTAASYALEYGSRRNAGGWGDGLTILTMLSDLQSDLAPEDRPLALYHGTRRAAEDTGGQMQRVQLEPLPQTDVPHAQLKRWFREFVEVRDDEAAERALRTAIAARWTPAELTDLLAAAATDHYYRDFSHVMDTLNHATRLLDMLGWERATDVLPALTAQWASASREEERNAWRHPENLAELVAERIPGLAEALRGEAERTPELVKALGGEAVRPEPVEGPAGASTHSPLSPPRPRAAIPWEPTLVDAILGDDPTRSLDAILTALRSGLSVSGAAQALAYASALRLTRFATSNEFGDWDTALHAFTYCASLAQVAKRAPSAELARA
ncbi:MAG TPA: Rieske (2Fe-2S) protein, partial [Chloroflexota bacterium]|nr:Rieske (2Fe-2S) protein [Chloroflexota bacterium]